MLKAILETGLFLRIIIISYRRSLSFDMHKNLSDYDFQNYIEVEKNDGNLFDCDKLIIQYESVKKINYDCYEVGCEPSENYYDLCIIDESESTLRQVDSSTNKEKQKQNFNAFKDIVSKSKKIIFMDGDLSSKTLSFASSFSNKNVVIKNNFTKSKIMNVIRNYGVFFDDIIENIKLKRKLYICCMSSSDSENYEKNIKEKFNEIKILRIYGNMSDAIKENIFKNVNEEFIKYDVVITTPTTEAGVDFNVENYFYKTYGIITQQSTTVSGFFQMTARVRNVENNEILIYSGNMTLNTVNFYTYEEIKENLRTIFDLDENTKKMLCENGKLNYDKDDDYIKNYIFNQVEIYNSKQQYFIAYIKLLCKEKNYEFKYSHETGDFKCVKNNYGKNDILNCICPNDKEYKNLKVLQDLGEATEKDKSRIAKYYYFVIILGYKYNEILEIEKEQKERIKIKCSEEENVKYSLSLTAEDEFNLVFKRNPINNFLSLIDIENFKKYANYNIDQNINSLKQLDYVKDVKDFLQYIGVENIAKENKIKNLKEKIEEKQDKLGIFKYKIKDDGKIFKTDKNDDIFKSSKKMIGYLNIMLGNFGLVLKWTRERETNKETKKQFYTNEYIINPINYIIPIIKRKLIYIKDTKNNLKNIKCENDNIFDVFDIKK